MPGKVFTFFLLFFVLIASDAASQNLTPKGVFLTDSAKLGEPVKYVLTLRYPRNMQVVFPSEGATYTPFEYLDREYFPTVSDSTTSFDSVVYELTTFELIPEQTLSLPVLAIEADDTISFQSSTDTVFLRELITTLPDTAVLKETAQWREMLSEFNYPYLVIGLVVFYVLALLFLLLFGEKLRSRWQLGRLQKRYRQFENEFEQGLKALQNQNGEKQMQHLLVLWKNYMEKLDKQPYSKLTTREISTLPQADSLKNSLKEIDRSLYGGVQHEKIIDNFRALKHFSSKKLEEKVAKIKHGESKR